MLSQMAPENSVEKIDRFFEKKRCFFDRTSFLVKAGI